MYIHENAIICLYHHYNSAVTIDYFIFITNCSYYKEYASWEVIELTTLQFIAIVESLTYGCRHGYYRLRKRLWMSISSMVSVGNRRL